MVARFKKNYHKPTDSYEGRHEHHPRVLLRVHPARAHQRAAAAQEPLRAAGHLGDPGVEHHGVPLHVRTLQRQSGM